ncbi:hypothetical protein [Pontibacter sp. G13]|uniref:hypothetical protein n=1 Tax=Pontibacter sp. G13 TaxID=3074898 RepID=UPI00288BADB9|nr:hypothetical protein [Pontibacter sp. G13]WNJ18220.1 hypothetical protein RJD25_25495 [Pontibacter sp. G13]
MKKLPFFLALFLGFTLSACQEEVMPPTLSSFEANGHAILDVPVAVSIGDTLRLDIVAEHAKGITKVELQDVFSNGEKHQLYVDFYATELTAASDPVVVISDFFAPGTPAQHAAISALGHEPHKYQGYYGLIDLHTSTIRTFELTVLAIDGEQLTQTFEVLVLP